MPKIPGWSRQQELEEDGPVTGPRKSKLRLAYISDRDQKARLYEFNTSYVLKITNRDDLHFEKRRNTKQSVYDNVRGLLKHCGEVVGPWCYKEYLKKNAPDRSDA